MKVLVTGAKGFVGKNLCAALNNIKQGKDRTHPELDIDEVFEYDINSKKEELVLFCKSADFVFNLAGVNRPEKDEEFMSGNFGFASSLLDELVNAGNTCPVMLSSSVQATLEGRYSGSVYGKSKKAGEDLFFDYSEKTGARVLVYRFPNLFGKWCRPNYNSAVATFCNNIACGLPITVNDRNTAIELVYIDDLIDEMLLALSGHESRCEYKDGKLVPTVSGRYCYVKTSYVKTLGEITDMLYEFSEQPETLIVPMAEAGSFKKKLYSTFISYLPKEAVSFPLKMNTDARGSFTELLKTIGCGQMSVNVTAPGITKGEHWHNSKWEIFIVVSGHGLIRERKIGSHEILDFEVSGDNITAVRMLPGYTHNIINLSDKDNLVTLMWANESFDPDRPDTFFEKVEK